MDWQPIATAPKDGTPVLVWEPAEPLIEASYYVAWYSFGWCRAGDDCQIAVWPTYWMPLPPPPTPPS